MKTWVKVAVVCGGYLLAFAAAGVASYLYDVRAAAQPYDTSGGMYAAGEALTGLGVFLMVALVPTLLGLWFVRRNARLWHVVAVASLAFASVGLLAVLMPLSFQGNLRNPVVFVLELLRIGQLIGMPLWTVAFVLFALLAPAPPARRLLSAAIGLELLIGVCAAVHWFVPRSPI